MKLTNEKIGYLSKRRDLLHFHIDFLTDLLELQKKRTT